MKTRILAGLALVPLLLLVILGGLPLYIGEFIIISIAINEFYKAFKVKQINPINNSGSRLKPIGLYDALCFISSRALEIMIG